MRNVTVLVSYSTPNAPPDIVIFSASLSEPSAESRQLCDIAPEYTGLERIYQQEPDEKRPETNCRSVSQASVFFCI